MDGMMAVFYVVPSLEHINLGGVHHHGPVDPNGSVVEHCSSTVSRQRWDSAAWGSGSRRRMRDNRRAQRGGVV
jgi:hypothetical protein